MRIIIENETNLNEMSTIRPRYSGLDYDVWVDNAGNGRNVQHNLPRLKVNVNGDKIPVSISDSPDVLAKNKKKDNIPNFRGLVKWIKLNKSLLLKFWSRQIEFDDLLNGLKKI